MKNLPFCTPLHTILQAQVLVGLEILTIQFLNIVLNNNSCHSSNLIWQAIKASETISSATRLLLRVEYSINWRASEASETVLEVDNAKSGICYNSASERSERS